MGMTAEARVDEIIGRRAEWIGADTGSYVNASKLRALVAAAITSAERDGEKMKDVWRGYFRPAWFNAIEYALSEK